MNNIFFQDPQTKVLKFVDKTFPIYGVICQISWISQMQQEPVKYDQEAFLKSLNVSPLQITVLCDG